ncbi:MAG: hypothetical protein ACRDU9_08490 [Acidimicrobiia bacterium]
MRKRIVTALAAATLMAAALPVSATPDLEWSKETNRSACGAKGAPVVNITQHVTGDVDSGFNGGWAVDIYARRIQVWEVDTDVYCAVVRYSGTFDAIAGANSPGQGSDGTLDGDEDGSLVGGYRALISTPLISDPAWPTRGTVGQFDYACTAPRVCPGAVDWVEQYFGPDYDFAYQFWGWVYRAGRHQTWVNASTGSSGDIN